MNNYLVTGATGFIGTRLVNALILDNHKVTCLSREKIKNLNSIVFDFSSDQISSINLNDIDVIFHLAGIAHDSGKSDAKDALHHKINTSGTIKLATLAVRSGVKKFVFISSVKASTKKNAGAYGRSKRQAELKLMELSEKSDMHISVIRPALVYGPDVKGNLKLMMDAIDKGWFPPLPRINNRRSMIHIDDLVEAILLIAETPESDGEIYIATDGIEYTSRQLYESLCQALGKSIPSWSVPLVIFKFISFFSPRMKTVCVKLLGDEYYSSRKLKSLGFKARRSILEINETSF